MRSERWHGRPRHGGPCDRGVVTRSYRGRCDRGMVTAEMAACLPVLALLVTVALAAVSVAGARVRVQDAAREAVRAAARGDPAAGQRLAAQVLPGVQVQITTSGDDLIAVAAVRVHPLTGWLPAVTLTERAVAAIEPQGASP